MPTTVLALKSASLALLTCAGTAASVALVPMAAADAVFPTAGAESASATVMDLQAQGYDVVINWLQGHPNVPLSECRVNGINNPNSGVPDSSTLSTVYVDIACPNAK